MCKRGGLLIAYDAKTKRALVTDADCESWKCEECAELLRGRWVMRAELGAKAFIRDGVRVDFITITSHEKLPNFAATERVWRSAWDALYQKLNRTAAVFEYMIIPEKHKDGRMHVHALWTAGVTERWLKNEARRRGLGYQAKVKPCKEVSHATRYVTKYIGKSLGDDVPKHFRRVRVSRGWAQIPAPVTADSGLEWEYIGTNGTLQMHYERCAAGHYDMVDVRTGEIFDDVDLGTIIYA